MRRVEMLLPATTPAAWLSSHLAARFDEHAEQTAAVASGWATTGDLLTERSAVLRSMHDRLVTNDGVPPAAAATYIVGWTAGALADAVGFGLATAAAGFVVGPAHVRWHQHSDGWMDRVELGGCHIVVTAGHPWAGCDGVEVVSDEGVVRQRAVTALVEIVAPIVDACHALARVGRAGLWNEVADGLGMAVCFQPSLPTHPDAVAALTGAVRAADVPWKARPRLRIVEDAALGPVYVGQKGGCCLAYTLRRDEAREQTDDEMTDERREYLARFPEIPGQPRYCSTCTFSDAGDVEARQLFWLERHRTSAAGGTAERS